MAEIKEYVAKTDENGSVTISEEVIASIASIAALEIDGVAALGTSTPPPQPSYGDATWR